MNEKDVADLNDTLAESTLVAYALRPLLVPSVASDLLVPEMHYDDDLFEYDDDPIIFY